MRRFNLLLFLLLVTMAVQAQFVNNGATVTIQSGATLRVETDFINNTGTVTNNGTLEVQGAFTNAATFTSANPSLVRFIGSTNSNVTSGGAMLRNVEMSKTANNITLLSPLTIAGDLNFVNDNNKVVLGANNLTLPTGATVTSPDANEYVVAVGAGKLIKGIGGNTPALVMEVGDASNYSPVSNNVTGSAYASATISARVTNATHGSKPVEADSYLSRYWEVGQTGISTYSNTITGTYITADDVVGTQSRIKGASYVAPNWSFAGAATNGTSTVTGITTSALVDFTGMNALNKINITALLYGAMPGAGSIMTSDLQNYFGGNTGLLPTTSPYGAPTSMYANINNPAGVAGTVTDWVKVEVRSAGSPGTILETRSLLLKANGSIVGVDGSIPYFKDQLVPARVSINHRNHQAILSNSLAGTFEAKDEAYDFTTALGQAANAGDPAQMLLKNGEWCMITGDVVNDYAIDGPDLTSVKIQFNMGTFDLYVPEDVNMDGAVDGVDLTLTKISFNAGYYSTLSNY